MVEPLAVRRQCCAGSTSNTKRFPRHARLLLPAEYNRVFAAGKRVSGPAVTLVLALRESLDQPARLGLALAKKQLKRAHERNRVKRLLREVFRHRAPALIGCDVVALARTAAQTMTNDALRTELERLISKAVEFCQSSSAATPPTTEPA